MWIKRFNACTGKPITRTNLHAMGIGSWLFAVIFASYFETFAALSKISCMSTTWGTCQSPIAPCALPEQSPFGDTAKHLSTALFSWALDFGENAVVGQDTEYIHYARKVCVWTVCGRLADASGLRVMHFATHLYRTPNCKLKLERSFCKFVLETTKYLSHLRAYIHTPV